MARHDQPGHRRAIRWPDRPVAPPQTSGLTAAADGSHPAPEAGEPVRGRKAQQPGRAAASAPAAPAGASPSEETHDRLLASGVSPVCGSSVFIGISQRWGAAELSPALSLGPADSGEGIRAKKNSGPYLHLRLFASEQSRTRRAGPTLTGRTARRLAAEKQAHRRRVPHPVPTPARCRASASSPAAMKVSKPMW